MEFHPVANIFPMMSAEEFEALKADIEAHGQLEPVWTYQDKIIDGRNRYQACQAVGVEPRYREWNGHGSLVAFVVSLNLKRRHLNESQRGMVAAKLANMERGGDRRSDQTANLQFEKVSRSEAAELLNVSERTVNAAAKVKTPELARAVESGKVSVSAAAEVAALPVETQKEIVARGEREILNAAKKIRAERQEERRKERLTKIAKISANSVQPLTAVGRYPLIYADPPWLYEFCSDDADNLENHYPTMTLDALCALPVAGATTDDCILFLWCTSPKLEEALRVINAWGFSYRSAAVWDKQWIGQGYYFRQTHEFLLVAVKGALPVPAPSNRPPSIFAEKRTEHSRKPQIAYELIEKMYPELPKLELFARTAREGWQAWGYEAGEGVPNE